MKRTEESFLISMKQKKSRTVGYINKREKLFESLNCNKTFGHKTLWKK